MIQNQIIDRPTINNPCQNITQERIAKFNDRELFQLCQQCGSNIRKFQKEFAAYLPEVEKRRLYKHYGCHTLYEFAAKLAGMHTDTVDDIMNVSKKLEDKPALQSLISKQGWSKVKVVATIATPETQKFWAEKVKIMSKDTLKIFVKELRKEGNEIAANGQTGLFANNAEVQIPGPGPSTPMEASQKTAITFKLDGDAETKLKIFKQRLEKKTKEPQDWNQTIKELLKIVEQHETCAREKLHQKTAAAKSNIESPLPSIKPETITDVREHHDHYPSSQEHETREPTKQQIQQTLPCRAKRYIPARVRHYLEQKYHGKCGFPNCKNPSKINHHTRRFSLEPTHDPDYIVPLCKPHERLAHHGLIQNEELPPEHWQVQQQPDRSSLKYMIDQKVQKFRMPVNQPAALSQSKQLNPNN